VKNDPVGACRRFVGVVSLSLSVEWACFLGLGDNLARPCRGDPTANLPGLAGALKIGFKGDRRETWSRSGLSFANMSGESVNFSALASGGML